MLLRAEAPATAGPAESAERTVRRFGKLGDARGVGWGRIALAQIALARGEPTDLEAALRTALGDEGFDGRYRAGVDDPTGTLDVIMAGY